VGLRQLPGDGRRRVPAPAPQRSTSCLRIRSRAPGGSSCSTRTSSSRIPASGPRQPGHTIEPSARPQQPTARPEP
jgi:hypothetical protein